MGSLRVLLLSAVLVVPAACQDESFLVSTNPCIVAKLISVDIGDDWDDLDMCRLKKSTLIDMVHPMQTPAPDTSTNKTSKKEDIMVKFTPEMAELQKCVPKPAVDNQPQVTRQEIMNDIKKNVALGHERVSLSEQARGHCEKLVYSRQEAPRNLIHPEEESDWQMGTHNEYFKYLKNTGQLTEEDTGPEESTTWDPQVTNNVDGDSQNWEMPKPVTQKPEPAPQLNENKAPVKNPQPKVQEEEDEDSGLVTRSTEEKWDSWVEQQLEAYLGHLKGSQPQNTIQVQTRESQNVPAPKQKFANGGKRRFKERASMRKRLEKEPQKEEIDESSATTKKKAKKDQIRDQLNPERKNPSTEKKTLGAAARQYDGEDGPWLKTVEPKKIGQGRKKLQKLRNAKREEAWRERAKAKVDQGTAKIRIDRREKKKAKRKLVAREKSPESDYKQILNSTKEKIQDKEQLMSAPREKTKEAAKEHELIPSWKIKRLIELIGERQRQAEVDDGTAQTWRSLSLQNQGSEGGKRKIIFKNVDTKQDDANRRSLFGNKRYWFKRGGRRKNKV